MLHTVIHVQQVLKAVWSSVQMSTYEFLASLTLHFLALLLVLAAQLACHFFCCMWQLSQNKDMLLFHSMHGNSVNIHVVFHCSILRPHKAKE